MVPRAELRVELLRRNGFEIVETFLEWFNVAGHPAAKKPSLHRRPGA